VSSDVHVEESVRQAAESRATALASGDGDALAALLHPDFRWTSHAGEHFDRATYLRANVGGPARWSGQRIEDVEVLVHDDAVAVLRCTVTDTVDHGAGSADFTMPMTQVWVRRDDVWVLLAGHAGPCVPRS
jgi:ketosteroid isomerase-like protein